MTSSLSHMAERIRSELVELELVLKKIEEGWNRAALSEDSYYLDGVALNLHGFYTGLERIFEVIAVNADGEKPKGQNWHQELLKQMSNEIHGIRPAVISESSCAKLNEYRGFRHIVRNVYTYNFDPVKIRKLVMALPDLFDQVRAELMAFADFIDQEE